MRLRRNFTKQPRSRKISGNDPCEIARILRRLAVLGHEIRYGKGQGFNHAFGDLKPERTALRQRRARHEKRQENEGQKEPGQTYHGHLILILSGLNVISIVRQPS